VRAILFIVFINASTLNAFCQPEGFFNGIYSTLESFKFDQLSDIRKTDSANYIYEALNLRLYIVRGGMREEAPDSIFGYFVNGRKYRAYKSPSRQAGSRYYRVEDKGCVIIYSKRGFYKTANKVFFYFSMDISSPIYALNMRQLRNHFTDPALIKELRSNRYRLTTQAGNQLRLNAIIRKFPNSARCPERLQ